MLNNKDNILEQFIHFSTSQSILGIIYGYARLASLKEGIRDVIFSEDKDKEEIKKVIKILEERKLDAELIKNAIPLMTNIEESISEEERKNFIQRITNDQKKYTASQILSIVLDFDIPELEIMEKGHSIDDVLDYVQKNSKDHSIKQTIDNKSEENVDISKDESKTVLKDSSNPVTKETRNQENISTKKVDSVSSFQSLIRQTVQLNDLLKSKVFGQDEAIRLFSEGFFQSEVFREEENNSPSAMFLFAGPPGVGKTYLASTAAKVLDIPFLSLDMSEYIGEDAVKKLSGVSKLYANSKPGILTDFVRKNKRCIVLLDEIEKAHSAVIYQFLQVMDAGTMTDGFTNEVVNFRDTILIFTTNVGKKLYENRDRMNLSGIPRSVVMKEIAKEKDEYGRPRFPGSMCSRFASGNVIMFNHLEVQCLVDIINMNFEKGAKALKDLYDIDIKIDPMLALMLIFSQSTNMDARNMSSQSILMLKNELYEFGRHVPQLSDTFGKLKKIQFKLGLSGEKQEIKELFYNSGKDEVLYIGNEEFDNLPIGKKCTLIASSKDTILDDIAKKDFSAVLIQIDYEKSGKEKYLSLDDSKSEGVLAFNLISEKVPFLPVYIVHKDDIRSEDKTNFLEKGARGFIHWQNDVDVAENILEICNSLYAQNRVNELCNRGRVLKYNTAQKISKDGKTAEIVFYDFKVSIAADADENKLLLSDYNRPKEKFSDIIGAQNAKDELLYFIDMLKNPKKYLGEGNKRPKGILLYGPPGTGKTMLAKAMAGESNINFFSATATGFMNKYYGQSEENIRNLFATARKFAPSIVFIDEIDAIGKERTGDSSNRASETLLNELLTQMDGFDENSSRPVFVVAATNFDLDGSVSGKAASIDGALLRRFDNRIFVDLPNEEERKRYIELELSKISKQNVSKKVIQNLSTRTTGESLANIKNVISLAKRNANKQGKLLSDDILLNAYEEYIFGEKKEWSEEYYKAVSIHESGHAYINMLSGERPSFITIISRGNFGGYMQHGSQEKTPSYTKEQLIWKIRTSLAGRAAEEEFFGESGINTGAASDLENATKIAFQIICAYGMVDNQMIAVNPNIALSGTMGEQLNQMANEIIQAEMKETKKLVHSGKTKIKALAKYLQKHNQATEEEIAAIFEK